MKNGRYALCRGIKRINSKRFLWEYKDCIRSAQVVAKDGPPTRAQQNKSLRDLVCVANKLRSRLDELDDINWDVFKDWNHELTDNSNFTNPDYEHIQSLLAEASETATTPKLITATKKLRSRFGALHEMTKHNVCHIMKLKATPDSDLLASMIEAAEWINTGEKRRVREHYFWIEVRLGQAFVNAGGKITKYEETDFANVLRQFRSDCDPGTALAPNSVGKERIVDLLDHILDARKITEVDLRGRWLSKKW